MQLSSRKFWERVTREVEYRLKEPENRFHYTYIREIVYGQRPNSRQIKQIANEVCDAEFTPEVAKLFLPSVAPQKRSLRRLGISE